jgi:hypothetical protein
VFKPPGRGCPGAPGCSDSFAFTPESGSCSVSLVAAEKKQKTASLGLAGSCVPGDRPQCRELLAAGGQRIELIQPGGEEQDEDSSPDEDSPPEENPPPGDQQPPPEENPPPDEDPTPPAS